MPDPKAAEQKPPETNEAITKVLEEIKDKLDNPTVPEKEPAAPSAPSYAAQRADLQKRMGFTDEQMTAHEESIMRANAPVVEQTGWTKLERKSDIENYRKEIEAELAIYPQERRTPEVMEKIYFFVKGKHADSKPAAPASGTKVVDTKVSRGPGYTGADPGMAAGGRGDGGTDEEENKLSDQEKFVASKLGVTEKEYADSRRVGKSIRELRVPDSRPVSSLADIELRRMTGARR